jgi:hypothetical protein
MFALTAVMLLVASAGIVAMTPTVMGVITPPGIPTTATIGQQYSVDLRDYLGAEFDPWFNGQAGYLVQPAQALPTWMTMSGVESGLITTGHLVLAGTPTEPGSHNIQIIFKQGAAEYDRVIWTINVVPVTSQFTINMLAGDTFSYTATTNVPSTFSISSGTLSKVGLSLSGATISGTAALGKETVTLKATSNDGGPVRYAYQVITFNVYRMLTLTGSVPAASWAGAAYSTSLTVADVDPDATGEVSLSLNSEATTAGYTLTKVSETSWKLERTAAKNVAGSVLVEVTASSNAGGIAQSRKISTTIATYADVAITSTPSGHRGSGTTVWLVEGDPTYTYTVTGTPDGVTFSATGLVGGMTFSDGKLTVPTIAPIPETTVTITASMTAGGETKTATQVLKVKVWDKNAFTSAPSVSDIVTTIDGRTVTASVIADNYTSIVWDMGDGTTYEGVTSVQHTYEGAGHYVIRVTVSNDKGEEASSVTAVSFGTIDPGGDDDDNIIGGISDFAKQYAWLIVAAAGVLALVVYAVAARHPLVLIVGIGLLLIAALLKTGVL